MFGVSLGWLPVAGTTTPTSYILPVLALAVGPAAVLARIIRVEMVTVLEADYVRTARAKRLPARTDLPRPRAAQRADRDAHARRPAARLAGRRHGARRERLRLARPRQHDRASILNKDYPVVQAIVLVYGVGVLLVNIVVDVVLALLDPRSTIRED